MPERTDAIRLRDLLPRATFQGAEDIVVRSCTADSRCCRPGDLFAALSGTRTDGHRFVAEAERRGATAILAERPLADCTLPVCLVDDSREAFGRICQALVGDPSQRMRVIGITGTNGKTTTSLLTASILSAAGYQTGIIGTLGSFDGFEWEPTTHTTPTAPQLAARLAHLESSGCTHAVIEVSSHALDQCRLAGVALDAVAVTNVRHDHLDYHETLEAYRAAKARIFEYLRGEGVAIFNADDPVTADMLGAFHGPALSVAMYTGGEWTGLPLEEFSSEQTFLLSIDDTSVPVRTHLIGQHNIYNCLVAAAIAGCYGIELPTIVRGLEAVTSVPGRLERIECGQPFGVYVDYAHTPDALSICLETLRRVARGRVICVFGAGGDRDREKRPLMGRAAESGADLVFVTSDNPRSEGSGDIANQILAGFRHPVQAQVELDRATAIATALNAARKGDCVLIAGKGHETGQEIGDRTLPLDDREFARAWLYQHWTPQFQQRAAA